MTSEKINDEIKEIKPTTPINHREIIEALLREKRIEEKYLFPFVRKIISEGLNRMPAFKIDLYNLDIQLLDLFRRDPIEFLNYFKKELYNRLSFEPEIKELIKTFNLKPNELHIVPIAKDFENIIPRIIDLSKNLTRFKNIFTYFNCRYMNIGIDKSLGFNWIKYQCPVCGSEFEKYYNNNIDTKIRKPDLCTKPKCHNKDFIIIGSDSFEIGSFLIEDVDIRKRNFISCYILQNFDYFIEKVKSINLNEEVEILGILQINYSDLVTRKETQKFDYYLEVFDINPKKMKTLDDNIIKTLEEKLKNERGYFEKLIDATHLLTYLIDIYFPIKLIASMCFITGGTWNHESNIRNTLNSIIAGPKNTYKSSIARNLESIIGKRHFLVYEVNKDMTKAGLIGTTQRVQNSINPIIRYGLLVLYSNGTIFLDESQKISMEILDTLRCLEKGSAGGVQDGVYFEGETKDSIILSQNCVLNRDGSYNAYEPLIKNLGWGDKNSESLLERFDLLYIIPTPDTFIKGRILDNEKKISEKKMLNEIAKDLEIDDYEFPKEIKSIKHKIESLLRHYYHKSKEKYKEIKLLEKDKDILRKLYRDVLIGKKDQFKTDTDLNIRSLNICYKVLKSLVALNFDNEVNNSTFNYFSQRCMKLIIPFRDSKLIETKTINIDKIFQEIISIIEPEEITTKELLLEISKYIKRTFYNDSTDEVFNEDIPSFIGTGYTFAENYKLKKLLKNNEDWLNQREYVIESGKGKRKVTTIKKI